MSKSKIPKWKATNPPPKQTLTIKRKRLKAITPSMWKVLDLIFNGRNPYQGCSNPQEFGARGVCILATRTRGLIDSSSKAKHGWALTHFGLAKRREHKKAK